MKKITDEKKTLLRAMLGMLPESYDFPNNVQLPVLCGSVEPVFPQGAVHYELYDGHVELHIESRSDDYAALCSFLQKHLPDDDVSCQCERGFCVFAYMLRRSVKGWDDITDLGNAIIKLRGIVEPVILDYKSKEMEKIKLAEELVEYYEEQKRKQPFHINVIDELHASENAHTRILTRLLDYQTDGTRAILNSFLELLPGFSATAEEVNDSQIYFNRDYIDCLIECPGKFAVIVENKIHNAVDQDKQIERYVDTEIDNGIPKGKIWVIYLTMDGSKVVDECSLTEKAKGILCDRFITLDYRNHILPWLKNSILPNCKLKEDWLITALKQYIDHLEGVFGIRLSQYQLLNQIRNKIYSSIGISNATSALERYSQMEKFSEQIEELRNKIDTLRDNIVNPIVERFKNATLQVLGEICPAINFRLDNKIPRVCYQIFVNDWGNRFWQIHFEWVPFSCKHLIGNGETKYKFVVHIEDRELENEADALLKDANVVEIGHRIGFSKIDSSTYYLKKATEKKSIAEMTDEELNEFLSEMYSDVPKLIEFMEKYKIAPTSK